MDPVSSSLAYLGLPENIVYYRVSNDHGKNWSGYKPVPGIIGACLIYQGKTDDYSMATDSAGNVHFVLVGQLANERFQPEIQLQPRPLTITSTIPGLVFTPEPVKPPLYVLHLTWNSGEWSGPEKSTYFAVMCPNGLASL